MDESPSGSRKGVWITVGVLVLAAIVIAVIMAYSGGGGTGGTGGY